MILSSSFLFFFFFVGPTAGDNLQCGAGDDLHVYVVLAVTYCIAACVLFHRYLYTRNHPDVT